MAEITVGQLAQQTNKEVDALLKQLKSFGIEKSSEKDTLTPTEMKTLLEKINSAKNTATRKKVTSVKLDGKHKINVSVKRKRRVAKKVEQQESTTLEQPQELETMVQEVSQQVDIVKEQDNIEQIVENKEAVKVQEQRQAEIAKPVIKDSGFKITAMPEIKIEEIVAEDDEGLAASDKQAKKKAAKKVFSEAVNTNTKYKREEEEKKSKAKKAGGKGFKKANPRQLSQLAGDLESFDEFGAKKGKLKAPKVKKQEFTKPVENTVRTVEIHEGITVSELAQKMAVKGAEIVKVLFNMGVMATINQSLDQDTAILIVEEMGHKYTLHNENALEEAVTIVDRSSYKKISRAPVVTIMGHVDHGKTSLLDYIRQTRVVAGEAGGITQHIGAYSVKTDKGSITFLDTPGHEAFTSMRARGAKSTDIVILVVAADDGVMPQTEEAIQHAKAARVPIVVAVNKIDKPEADPDKVISELAQRNVIPESWGGDVMFVNVSAKTGEGVADLLEAVLLQSEVLELEAFAEGLAEGVVIESRLEKGRGPVATVLVQNGNLKQGDNILCGTEYGRVRAMHNDLGKKIKAAGPATPVEILGLSGVPAAGDEMVVIENEKKAKELAAQRSQKQKEAKIAQEQSLKLSNMFNNMGKEGEQQVLKIILKGDVQGSVEAIRESLLKLSTDEVKVDIIASGIGAITSSDVTLAVASTAVVIGFNVRADSAAKKLAETDGVEFRYYNIIYDLIDDVKKAMSGLLSPEMKEQIIGIAEVREVYRSSKFGSIAGCMVIEGVVKRTNPIRVLRNNVVIYEGTLESLKRFKDDASEVKKGLECGIGVKNYNDVREGDQIEVFEVAKEL
ncbi:translation initiation factor IF-2 [Francisella tularensis]|uniref:Translation initiation factor IF-2 n=1 Tax=Francisella tularensis subsp. tularensis (strain WY96-3418) TaxID=418136 RepID=IF2_FRATW|nr:translation initiation factor IF-2 [Francisella tularensis]A4IW10.1 RecName: Full=Translation initiation factor IF-2 [Francisella tularensis subsp. tularensis WY96-3418]ABO46112.1 translation initiation factor IF-2 [Francisella tularensis subsp. tularensis WY96-3418]AJI63793.1 translation initiation factor IF-2 [Francisella tularensis subsp. tularensis]AKH91234.1 translation initiation factor IF-2 [Francisella tularensis subsp. tularensis WY-00W4114]AKU74007.1 translation initiation factor 